MNGAVPEIYWYVFWVGLFIVVEAFGFYMATIIHRRNMRVLDLLKSYADKGIEPPGGVAELLSEQVKDPGRAWKSTPRGARLERFTGFLWGCDRIPSESREWAAGQNSQNQRPGIGAAGVSRADIDVECPRT